MNIITKAISPRMLASPLRSILIQGSRGLSVLSTSLVSGPCNTDRRFMSPGTLSQQQVRTYKERTVLKRRCAACYFVKRFGRLYVECDLKARHKQRQKLFGQQNYKDDYSKGKWQKAIFFDYQKKDLYYKQGQNQFAKHRWLDGKLGTEV